MSLTVAVLPLTFLLRTSLPDFMFHPNVTTMTTTAPTTVMAIPAPTAGP